MPARELNPGVLLAACRAHDIPEGESGPWSVKKLHLERAGNDVTLSPGTYTQLFRHTLRTWHESIGECVMHDYDDELRKHLDFMLRAHGRVLITGLGLGCVVRGALANPAVESVTVVERDDHVLQLVQPHMPQTARLRILRANALAYCHTTDEQFDCAWHDLWTDESAGEPHLAVRHMEVACEASRIVKAFQGAWAFPRYYRRIMKQTAKFI